MAFDMSLALQAQEVLDRIADEKRRGKVENALAKLANNPRHPGLNSHRFDALDHIFDETVWESYVENSAPSAWRIWWCYGPSQGQITVLKIGPHP
ncbi:MAG: hypothetical protein ACRDYB_07290 [Acidimicrobiales bacterium]